MNKSAVARQARSAAQAPGGVSSASRDIRGAGLSQSSGTVSEASDLQAASKGWPQRVHIFLREGVVASGQPIDINSIISPVLPMRPFAESETLWRKRGFRSPPSCYGRCGPGLVATKDLPSTLSPAVLCQHGHAAVARPCETRATQKLRPTIVHKLPHGTLDKIFIPTIVRHFSCVLDKRFIAFQDDLSSSADSDRNSDSDSDTAGVRSDGGSGERDPLDRRETLVCNRLQVVMQAMTVLVGSRLEGRCIEKLVSSASRIFRAITKVCTGCKRRIHRRAYDEENVSSRGGLKAVGICRWSAFFRVRVLAER